MTTDLIKLTKEKLPNNFKTWSHFYNYLKEKGIETSSSPDTKVSFSLMEGEGKKIIYTIKLGDLKSFVFDEMEELFLEDDLIQRVSQMVHFNLGNDFSFEEIEQIMTLLVKSRKVKIEPSNIFQR